MVDVCRVYSDAFGCLHGKDAFLFASYADIVNNRYWDEKALTTVVFLYLILVA